MKQRIKNPDLARLFENTFPSTLDTTVKYFDPSLNLAFIITGVSFPNGYHCAHELVVLKLCADIEITGYHVRTPIKPQLTRDESANADECISLQCAVAPRHG
jgi:hypothetical protein